MRKLAICVALAAAILGGCVTTPEDGGSTLPPTAPSIIEQVEIAAAIAAAPKADRLELLVAVTAEVGARYRCPRNQLELDVLGALRFSFDLFARQRIAAESAAIVDSLRLRTNAACGIVVVPPAQPDVPAAPTPDPAPPL